MALPRKWALSPSHDCGVPRGRRPNQSPFSSGRLTGKHRDQQSLFTQMPLQLMWPIL